VCHDEQTGWNFYNVYDPDSLLQGVRQVHMIFLLVGGLTLAIASFFILYFAKQINHSVNEVVEGMQEIQEGNLDVVLPIHSRDEFGLIADNFNHMTNRVNDLIDEVRHALAQQKNAEIHALEAQINPHFLYNTLDSINWMAIEKEEYEISKMLRDLGVILRYSIGKSNGMVNVSEVADWLEKYIGLQKMRFDNVFEYTITIEETAKNCVVHKLLLQPFIENAIIHGLKELDGGGMLRVDFTLSEDQQYLHITVEDNGTGMPREMAQKYNDVAWAVNDGGDSIGLHNAFSRMHMYYGDKASWKVTGIENMGTVIMLKLPADWRDTDAYTDC
ncbi:MAG: sensor histidine kinase, partial [Lachnospiraceae bacterium]|nr:sensor histidine kinase [Lachnospiraceae bacterium]